MATTEKQLIHLKVTFTVITSDNLKKIVFGLTKDTKDGNETWTINFALSDKQKATDADFSPRVTADIELELALHQLAEETATDGLNDTQATTSIRLLLLPPTS